MQLFNEQQSMFNYLRNDLRKYKEVFQKSIDHETMYSPLTPTHQYSTQELNALPKTNEGIVDLSSVMEEYKEPFKAYENQIQELKRELTFVKSEEQKSTNLKEEMEQKLSKLQERYDEMSRGINEEKKRRQVEQKKEDERRD